MAPLVVIPTKPKLSSSDAFPALLENNPIASEEIKGTVKTPVVAPGASNDIEINSGGAIKARTNITEYAIVKKIGKGILKRGLNTPNVINAPTPIDTETITRDLAMAPAVT